MHGRLKVKSTAEQLEAKRKEREKKLQLYNSATSKIFSKRQIGELDEELLYLCGEVLTVNPDFYTLWNFRKEVFEKLQHSLTKEKFQSLLQSELFFLETCLKINPKSYGTWHHRCFVMTTIPDPDWGRELELCSQFLKYDERNFHCWDYRRFVVKRANILHEAELEFSLSKISNNFSNYSSWHYRSKLLPVIYPDSAQPMGVTETALLKEYELVQNGLFTDPDDQSNWFYHRWLMGRGEYKQAINSVSVSREDKTITVSFQRHIQVVRKTDILILCNGTCVFDLTWLNQARTKAFSTLWIASGADVPIGASLHVQLVTDGDEVCSRQFTLDEEHPSMHWLPQDGTSRFRPELSAVKSNTLQQELESVMQLMEVEPENKWAVLTAALLMKALDPDKNRAEIFKFLQQLEELDAKRTGYFRDLRSKFVLEDAIDAMDREGKLSSLCVRGKQLTKLYHAELLPLVVDVNLSDNILENIRPLSLMVNLREIRLSHNKIKTCLGLQHLPHLVKLYIDNNKLSSEESLAPLQTCSRLTLVDVTLNPVTEKVKDMEKIREKMIHVQIVS